MSIEKYKLGKGNFLTKNPYCANVHCPPKNTHSHEYFEIAFAVKNTCTAVINEKEYPFSYGTCILVRPTDSHSYKNIPRCKLGDYMHNDVYVTTEKMKKVCDFLSPSLYDEIQNEPEPIVFNLSSSLIKAVLQQFAFLQSNKNAGEIIDTTHSTIITLLLSRYTEEKFLYLSNEHLPEWITKLCSKLSSPDYMLLSITEISTDVGYTPEYLSREFHKFMGITLRKYIIQKKMEYASTIMAINNVKIIDVAQMLGYSNSSNFSKNFFDVFGLTPIQYKQECSKSSFFLNDEIDENK